MEPTLDVLVERMDNCQRREEERANRADARILNVEGKCDDVAKLLQEMRTEWLVGRAQLTAGSKLFIALMTGVVAPLLSALVMYLLKQ